MSADDRARLVRKTVGDDGRGDGVSDSDDCPSAKLPIPTGTINVISRAPVMDTSYNDMKTEVDGFPSLRLSQIAPVGNTSIRKGSLKEICTKLDSNLGFSANSAHLSSLLHKDPYTSTPLHDRHIPIAAKLYILNRGFVKLEIEPRKEDRGGEIQLRGSQTGAPEKSINSNLNQNRAKKAKENSN